jgi:crotonobetainyl-CoA:carnitine CoA-transferase CaiB-like acyl-CoA transferase
MYALENIRVCNLGAYIAGGLCGALLADMGADVVKVETLTGDPFRQMASAFLAYNHGEKSIAVNLTQKEGRQVVYKLAERSDVFSENFRPGISEKLGVDYESIRKVKPNIIYVSILGHGSTGPYRTWPGFDPLLQARGGIMAGQGGKGNQPVYQRIAVSDYAAAMLGAYGAMLALYVRNRTGQGQHVETSLTNGVISIQSGEFLDYEGIPRKERGGVDIKGKSATCRLYRAKDDWLFVLCDKAAHWRQLCKVLGLENLMKGPRFKTDKARQTNDAALAAILESTFAKKPVAAWLKELEDAGVPCAPQMTLEGMASDPHYNANDLICAHQHPIHGRVTELALAAKLHDTPGKVFRPALLLGEYTDEVLAELGYTPQEIADLKARRIVAGHNRD